MRTNFIVSKLITNKKRNPVVLKLIHTKRNKSSVLQHALLNKNLIRSSVDLTAMDLLFELLNLLSISNT